MIIIDEDLRFGSMTMGNNPNTIIVHHIEAEGSNWTVNMIHNMHKNENGWAGIGYHYYIRLNGNVYKGRPDNAIGAHCAGCNENTLGVAFEGNYDSRTEMPEAQYNAWCALKTYLCNKYGNMGVYGHREKGSSVCPGKYFPLDKIKGGSSTIAQTVSESPVDNEEIKLQKVLNKLKIRDGKGNPLDEDGIIGRYTKEAVKRFQSICNLTVDGVAGGQTWNAIDDILCRPPLEVGSRGVVVRYLQYRVGCTHDGVFGWDTNRYVAIWQGQNFCTQDGVVGPQTWNKMIG